MTLRALALLVLAATLLAPPAWAHEPTCEEATDAGAVGAVALYVGSEGGVWRESNNIPGLQTEHCVDADGRNRPKDARVL